MSVKVMSVPDIFSDSNFSNLHYSGEEALWIEQSSEPNRSRKLEICCPVLKLFDTEKEINVPKHMSMEYDLKLGNIGPMSLIRIISYLGAIPIGRQAYWHNILTIFYSCCKDSELHS